MPSITLSQYEYETLVDYARQGTLDVNGQVNQDKALGLESWLQQIESKNNIVRHAIWIQWQEQDAPLPPGTNFPTVWPPQMRHRLAIISRPIARSDVETVLAAKARKPTSVLVTRDPAALVGWTELDVFFV